ncbi:Outer membrane protein [Hahella chejuensis KCTC 2396]|uniref:Outer membrane protein n=1 Tax=Hahella chejuensis (strain KCTC 2396) TaxID=349521 RepID=Q2SHT9_HAHCH|nr:TolC family protein [Hahella chejuensis]ABC29785.1 Outer membrane protein [Hahella chejuensis KCTC 2396]
MKPLQTLFLSSLLLGWSIAASAQSLTLSQAESLALQRDAEIARLQQLSLASEDMAVADGQLPDPSLSLGVLNLPTDSFATDQEPMTQFRVGLGQKFPAGDTLALTRRRGEQNAVAQRWMAQDRAHQVRREVRLAWLESLYWKQAQNVYRQDEGLFQQLQEVTQSLYSVGRSKQQDVLRADLELSQLNDRLINARQKEDEARARLARWVGPEAISRELNAALPDLNAPHVGALESALLAHPAVKALDAEVSVSATNAALAQQSYKPSWGVDVGYAWRDGENMDGSARADFFSAAVSVQLPLFTGQRQDRRVAAAARNQEASRSRRLEMLRMMDAEAQVAFSRWRQAQDRGRLYKEQITPQALSQADSALTSYQSDRADFAEVMRAYLTVQKLRLEQLRIDIDGRAALARLDYFFASESPIDSLSFKE